MLPPIIEDYIAKVNDPNTPVHIRENYAQMLQQIVDKSQAALNYFNNDKTKHTAMFGRRK